ncbi:MAG: cytochrome c family protein [Paracoccaceae bacterium]
MRLRLLASAASAVVLSASHMAYAQGDTSKGARVFKKCATCHSTSTGQNKQGPHLKGIWGRPAGKVRRYNYSSAMRKAGLVWEDATLRAFLTDPGGTVPGTKMSFSGIKNQDDLTNLLAYLRGL